MLFRRRVELETSMRGSSFIFVCVCLLYYKCPRINLREVVVLSLIVFLYCIANILREVAVLSLIVLFIMLQNVLK